MRILRLFVLTSAGVFLLFKQAECQTVSRINGLTQPKWISVKHTLSPGRVLQHNGQNYTAEFEDIYAKIWIPLVLTKQLKVAAGVFYRTEQIEAERLQGSEFNKIDHWNLRSAGIDVKTVAQLSDRNSLMVGTSLSHSATIQSVPLRSSPLNFSVSVILMQKKSDNKEVGLGLLHSSTMNHLPFLPIIIWNQTFDEKSGVEISLPYKMAWRYNLSERDILRLKAEGTSRTYFMDQPSTHQCRRIDVDLGISYTRMINKWIGFEFFGGFRQNISSELPNEIRLRTSSGLAISGELFVIPAFNAAKLKK